MNKKERIKYQNSWRKKNPDKFNTKQKKWYNKTKLSLLLQLLNHYGHKCNCKNCPEKNFQFFTLDHINNDGAAHRRALGGQSTINTYRDVIKRGFPPDYQILCMNCNWAKGVFGKCPHNNTPIIL